MTFRLLALLEQDPNLSQRQIATFLGIRLGKVDDCLRALRQKGFVKARNFRRSCNKLDYRYILSPKGVQQKIAAATRFLHRKDEHERLVREIEELRAEVASLRTPSETHEPKGRV
ncbi:MAG TPA: MarR family EPS-associated transcriptional regulator [Thermoanaerobaculia bacterium]|nr:MarR family EPS-associated transcriptional regulator [Thermoanaerobaculia bacterium]